jgi:hypothetical protein
MQRDRSLHAASDSPFVPVDTLSKTFLLPRRLHELVIIAVDNPLLTCYIWPVAHHTENETIKMTVLWDTVPYIAVHTNRRFRGDKCLHHQGFKCRPSAQIFVLNGQGVTIFTVIFLHCINTDIILYLLIIKWKWDLDVLRINHTEILLHVSGVLFRMWSSMIPY